MNKQLKIASPNTLPQEKPVWIYPDSSKSRKGYEVERATLVELEVFLEGLSQRYKGELRRQIHDCRLVNSSLAVTEFNKFYLEAEDKIARQYIERLFKLYKQSCNEMRAIRKQINKDS